MQVKNIMEETVARALASIIACKGKYGVAEICTCERCQLDILAMTLNKLPPKYVVTERGEVLARAYSLNNQFDVDILHALLAAIKQVSSQPRH